MSYYQIGESEQARATFRQAERRWKEAIDIYRAQESFLEAVWQEARALLDG
jgi:hypothetical protein